MIIGFEIGTREPSKKSGAPGRMWPGATLRLLVQSNLSPLHHHKGAWTLCGGWRLSGGESRRVSRLLRLEVGVAPDDLDDVAEH